MVNRIRPRLIAGACCYFWDFFRSRQYARRRWRSQSGEQHTCRISVALKGLPQMTQVLMYGGFARRGTFFAALPSEVV